MNVAEIFKGWFRQYKAERLAEFFSDVLDREVVSQSKECGVGGEGEIPLTVHTVVFDGPPVAPRDRKGFRETMIRGNRLVYPS